MNCCTEIPKFDPEEFAEAADSTHRETLIPVFDVSVLGRGADVKPLDLPFALSDVPILGTLSTGTNAIDHRAAFLLLNIDGLSSFETVIRLSHVPEAEACVALVNMLAVGLIAIRGAEQGETTSRQKSGLWARNPGPQAANDLECWMMAIE